VKKDELHCYRQPAVLVAFEKSAGVAQLDAEEIDLVQNFGALAAGYALDNDAAAVRIKLSRNDPQLRAVIVTALDRDAENWMAEVTCRLDVAGGQADALRFEIPPQWSEPFQLNPPMAYEVQSAAGEQRRELVLFPDEPLAGQREITIRGRVAPSPGDRLSAPDVLLLRARELERFLVLPRELEGQQVTWDTLGLASAELPRELAGTSKSASTAVYKVAGEHFQASLKAVERPGEVAGVALVDIHVVARPDGGYVAAAAFDLEPDGSSHGVLELPEGCRLVHASVEKLPALVTALPANRWRLDLGPQQLPQHVEVLYTRGASPTAGRTTFDAPRVVDRKVRQVLWTVYGQPVLGFPEPRQSDWRVGAAEQQLRRLTSLAGLVELEPEVVAEHLPEEIARWYDAWRARYRSARAELHSELIASRRDTAQAEENISARKLDDRVRTVDERLGAARAMARQVPQSDATPQLAAVARARLWPARFAATDLRRLELRYGSTATDRLVSRILAGTAILMVAGAAAWWLGKRALPVFPASLVAGGIGLAWWLALDASFLGLLVFSAAASAAAWSRWRRGPREQAV
jgi:hypothetical protein